MKSLLSQSLGGVTWSCCGAAPEPPAFHSIFETEVQNSPLFTTKNTFRKRWILVLERQRALFGRMGFFVCTDGLKSGVRILPRFFIDAKKKRFTHDLST